MGAENAINNVNLRTQILDAARHLMVTDGYDNVSMRKIANSIGYSATSIYLHFKSKDDLFHTLIDEGMDRLHEVLVSARTTLSPRTAIEELESICKSFIDFGLANSEYYEVMFVLHPDTGKRYPAEKYRKARRNIEVIETTIKRGLGEGALFVRDTYLAANTIWAMLHGVVTLLIARRVDKNISSAQLSSSVIGNILNGLQVKKEPRSSQSQISL